DQRVLLLHRAFCRGDVGATLEQGRRNRDRDLRNASGQRIRRDRELGGGPADQHRDRVLELRTLHPDVKGLRLGRKDLGLRGGDIRLRYRIAAVELVLHDFERLLVFLDRAVEQFAQGVRGAEVEKGDGQRALRRELGIVEVRRARLRGGRI